MDNLVRLILLVAPEAQFIFTPIETSNVEGGYIEKEIVNSLMSLLSSKPDILLFTFGPSISPRLMRLLSDASEQGTSVIVASFATDPMYTQLPYEIPPDIITVAGLTLDEKPIGVMPANLDVQQFFWMRSQELPVLKNGRIEPRSSISYSSAITAGALWYIKYLDHNLSPSEITQVLHSSSTVGDNLPTININAAIKEIKQLTLGEIVLFQKDVNMAIPDNDPLGITSTQKVSKQGKIKRIQVAVDINHVYIGDITLKLIPPIGKHIFLHNREGEFRNDIKKTFIKELSSLIGNDAQGDWSLHVSDQSAFDIGTLNSWSLEITYEE
jgi:hypothetical protein